MALFGGIALILFRTQGLLLWAGFVAWAAFLDAGGDGAALKKTIVGNIFGAFMAWVALLLVLYVVVPAGSWLWMPRTALAVAVTLLVLGLAARSELLSHVPSSLYGYAAVFGSWAVVVPDSPGPERLTDLHLYNPIIVVVISMVIGAVFGLLSNKLADSLAAKK
jgi:hypothetical protein